MQSPYGDECINGFLYSLQTEKSVEMVFYAVSIRRRLHLCIFYLFSIWRRSFLCIFCVFPVLGKDVKCIWVVRNGRGQLFFGCFGWLLAVVVHGAWTEMCCKLVFISLINWRLVLVFLVAIVCFGKKRTVICACCKQNSFNYYQFGTANVKIIFG
jgi:hypothetical protein